MNKTLPPSNRGRENKQQEQKWHTNREVCPDSRVRKPVPGTWKALHLFCPQNVRDQYFNEIIIHATATNKLRHISIHLLIYRNSLRCISASMILLQQRATTVNTPPFARRAISPQFVGAYFDAAVGALVLLGVSVFDLNGEHLSIHHSILFLFRISKHSFEN